MTVTIPGQRITNYINHLKVEAHKLPYDDAHYSLV